ncbi:MAG TPA: hypothetical protein PKL16_01900, partial [Anaerolineae bacterium]|nr:hypothetical protein [Anaerolineae bacterium]HQM14845.1 hypothetical protein [Anaerolineae bacterium]
FCGVLQAGVARLQNPCFFLPLPNGVCAIGEGAGGGAKATDYKGSSIAVELPGARLNNDRTFSFLDDVRQHMASPRKIGGSAKRRKSESLTFAPPHVHTFTRSHFPTFSNFTTKARRHNARPGREGVFEKAKNQL